RGEERWKPARYAAFVVRADEPAAVRMIDLGDAAEIDNQIRAYRAELLGDDEGSRGMVVFDEPTPVAPTSLGAVLRGTIFGPLREAIAGAGHLILATDGELATLPFEVLPGPDGRPLIESFRLSYLAVGRDILRTGERPLVGATAPAVFA